MKKTDNLSIIVYSCWKNKGMWPIFSSFFIKFWPDCKYSIYLLTDKFIESEINKNELCFHDVIIKDDSWGEMIKYAIKNIESKYISLWMDDYLLTDYINNKQIEVLLEDIENYGIDCVQLFKSPVCKYEKKVIANMPVIKNGSAYCLSLHIAIWNVDFLMDFIIPQWSAWDFERIGSLKLKGSNVLIVSNNRFPFPYTEAVRTGKWMPEGMKLCKKMNIDYKLSGKSGMSVMDVFVMYIKAAILHINPGLVLHVQACIYRIVEKIHK